MDNPLYMALIATGVLSVILIGIALWQRRKHGDRVERLETRANEQIDRLHSEHTQQVDRLTREWEGERKRAHLDLARDILPAVDAVESALENADPDDGMARGIEMVHRELTEALRAHDVERIAPAAGEAFDPNLHEAVDTTDPTDDIPAGTVAACYRAGYRHPEAVLRPAMVSVARA